MPREWLIAVACMESQSVWFTSSEAREMHRVIYVGMTDDVDARLEWHNNGPCGHTRNHRLWSVVVTITLETERAATRFEKYLKSGSGREFAKRHFSRSDDRPDNDS